MDLKLIEVDHTKGKIFSYDEENESGNYKFVGKATVFSLNNNENFKINYCDVSELYCQNILFLYNLNLDNIILPKKSKELKITNSYCTDFLKLPKILSHLDIESDSCKIKINELPNLTTLHIKCSEKNNINDGNVDLSELHDLPNTLREMVCSYTKLTYLNNLPNNSKVINLNNNNLTSLDNIQIPNKLQNLSIRNNKLLSFPSLYNNSLKFLDISFNELMEFPKIIGEIKNLKELNISNNKIKGNIILPNSLKIIDCSNNEITEIDNFPNQLITFIGNNNQLKIIPPIHNKLKHIYLNDNPIEYLPALHNNINLHLNGKIKDIEISNDIKFDSKSSFSFYIENYDILINKPIKFNNYMKQKRLIMNKIKRVN